MPLTREAKEAIVERSPLVHRGSKGRYVFYYNRIAVKRVRTDHVEVTFLDGALPLHRTEMRLEVGDVLNLDGSDGAVAGELPFWVE